MLTNQNSGNYYLKPTHDCCMLHADLGCCCVGINLFYMDVGAENKCIFTALPCVPVTPNHCSAVLLLHSSLLLSSVFMNVTKNPVTVLLCTLLLHCGDKRNFLFFVFVFFFTFYGFSRKELHVNVILSKMLFCNKIYI